MNLPIKYILVLVNEASFSDERLCTKFAPLPLQKGSQTRPNRDLVTCIFPLSLYLIGSLCFLSAGIGQSNFFGFGFEKHSKKTG